jgi:hypothetical protein
MVRDLEVDEKILASVSVKRCLLWRMSPDVNKKINTFCWFVDEKKTHLEDSKSTLGSITCEEAKQHAKRSE